jgi:hypothetical protein
VFLIGVEMEVPQNMMNDRCQHHTRQHQENNAS